MHVGRTAERAPPPSCAHAGPHPAGAESGCWSLQKPLRVGAPVWTVDSQVANGLGANGALSGAVQAGLGCSFVGEEARRQGRDSIGGKGGGVFQSRQLTSCLLCTMRDKVKKHT